MSTTILQTEGLKANWFISNEECAAVAKSFYSLWLPVAAISLLACGTVPVVAAGAHLCRGISIFDMMASPNASPPGSTNYLWPPFQGPDYNISDSDLARLHADGFDFIRIVVNPGIFLEEKGPREQTLFTLLRQNIRRALDANFKVIVDFHPSESKVEYGKDNLVSPPGSPIFTRYLHLLSKTAETLSTFPQNEVALEFINEPPVHAAWTNFYQWQRMVIEYLKVTREVAPQLYVVVSAGQSGQISGLGDLDPSALDNTRIIYTVHYYLPKMFTQQHIPGDPVFRYLTDVPFPASSGDFQDTLAMSEKQVDADNTLTDSQKSSAKQKLSELLKAYFAANPGPWMIHADFKKIAAWADEYGIPHGHILIGEFGVTRTTGNRVGAADKDRVAWLKDVRTEAENQGFGWSIWVDKGGMMAISDGAANSNIDPLTLHALGLGLDQPKTWSCDP